MITKNTLENIKNKSKQESKEIDEIIEKLKKLLNQREVSSTNFTILDYDKKTGKEFKYKMLYLSDVRRHKGGKIKVIYNKKLKRYEILTIEEAKKYIDYLTHLQI
jgi:phosphoribosylformylglycinamidine (FGAM) synthase-like enzyme